MQVAASIGLYAEKLVFYTQTQDNSDQKQIPDAEINDIQELLDLLPGLKRK